MHLKEIGEDRIIEGLRKAFSGAHPRLLKSIGDDTSVTAHKAGHVLLATTDTLVEGTHFKRGCAPAYLLGKKALSISLSDIAAMGGAPFFYLVSIALPPKTDKKFLDELYRGLDERARRFGAVLAGGNISRASSIMISTTVIGEMPAGEVVYRAGAKEGDVIYVTGAVGDSALGLKILKKEGKRALNGPLKATALKHLDPLPRLEAGRMLAAQRLASSMIDISDGVALDLGRLCKESSMGAVIWLERLPTSPQFDRYTRRSKKLLTELALCGGEDYELLFTSAARNAKKIALLGKRLKLSITPVGKVVKRPKGVRVIDYRGMPVATGRAGFEHF